MLERLPTRRTRFPAPPDDASSHPCDNFIVTSGGITCESFEWNVRANVRFPNLPGRASFPATLVRWPTASATAAGRVVRLQQRDYVPYGGGSPGSASWRLAEPAPDLTLRRQA